MRTLSRRIRWRTTFLVSARKAPEISFSRPSNWPASAALTSSLSASVASSRSCLPAICCACGELVADVRLDGGVDVVLVVEEAGELGDRLGGLLGQRGLRVAQRLDEGLGGLEALGHDLLGRGGGATGDQLDRLLGGLGLDHHDRDVAVREDAAGHDHVEDGVLELGVGREADPLAVDQGDAGAADRAGERQAGELGGRRGAVDREHVVEVLRGPATGR